MSHNNDLISRSALLSKRRTIKPPECNSCEYEHMEYVRAEDVQNAPAVDAVEVVRCKDCGRRNLIGLCAYTNKFVPDGGFCYLGKRCKSE